MRISVFIYLLPFKLCGNEGRKGPKCTMANYHHNKAV